MRAAVIVFPGSNCDRDVAIALEESLARLGIDGRVEMVWHGNSLPAGLDLVVLPGGFSYGDYLRAGAIAAHAPAMRDLVPRARAGLPVLGICNGFQILCEAGLLPGAILRNSGLTFLCKTVPLRVERNDTIYTAGYPAGGVIHVPISHHDGNYAGDSETLARVEGEGMVALRYCSASGAVDDAGNPNGSANNIAGLIAPSGRIFGLMPHPDRACDPLHGGTDGRRLFDSALEALA